MKKNIKNILEEKNVILDLYKDGVVKVKNIFDTSFLNEVKLAKNKIFSQFPYGQNNNFEKILDLAEANKIGYYPIKNLLELDPIFMKILNNNYINFMAEEILGKNFYFTDITMRIVPKTKNILETHRDFCGGLSFSLLLDNISMDEGETFFFKDSYKNPPSPFVDLNKFSSDIMPTTGEMGDVYFWFPDNWHGRNQNLSDKQTCILMVDIENENTQKKNFHIYKNLTKKKLSLFNYILKYIGNAPSNLIKNILFCIFRFKIFKNKIEKEKNVYTRLVLKNSFSEIFSLLNYFKMIDLKKSIKILMSKIIQIIIGKKFSTRLKKIIR